jgi:hypothetical protein
MRKALLASTPLLLILFSACDPPANSNTVTPTKEFETAKREEEFQAIDESEANIQLRVEARVAAANFVKAKLPKWTIKGMSSNAYKWNVFWVDVDIERDTHGLVLNLQVEKFFPESGEAYWKAMPMKKALDDELHDINDADILKQLNDARQELDKANEP